MSNVENLRNRSHRAITTSSQYLTIYLPFARPENFFAGGGGGDLSLSPSSYATDFDHNTKNLKDISSYLLFV